MVFLDTQLSQEAKLGKIKNEAIANQEFEKFGREILKHKYLYYIKNEPIISDYDYDMMERKYTDMARDIKIRPEVSMISDWAHLDWLHIATIVGFPEEHPWAKDIIKEVDGE